MARLIPRGKHIYEAVERWKEQCLLADGSIFGIEPLWTSEYLSTLIRDFVENLDEGKRTFEEKLKDQLHGAGPGPTRLAAEMIWVMMLFPSNITIDRKTDLVRTIWGWSGTSLPDKQWALDALKEGIGGGGTGYNTYRPFELQLLIRFSAAFKALPATVRTGLLSDGWAFTEWFDRLPSGTARQIRHMLLHLLFPDEFERVSSTGDKKRIDDALSGSLNPTDLDPSAIAATAYARDKRLLAIRRVLESTIPNEQIDFYENDTVRGKWKPAVSQESALSRAAVRESRSPGYTAGGRAWAIGAGAGARRVKMFLEADVIAIEWDELGDLSAFASREDVLVALKRVYNRENNPSNDALACYQFAHEIAVGDEVFVKQGRDRVLAYGKIVGEYMYDASQPDFKSRRAVEWIREGNWVLPESAQLPIKTLTEVTSLTSFKVFMGARQDEGKPAAAAPEPYGIEDILKEAFLSQAEVERILRSLRRRKNLILQGSPGVGKSFLARRLAYALVGAKAADNVQMVQFHQSYSYEDFIQGWRPRSEGGFERKNGGFYEFCRKAQERPLQPHVFIIDEVNRGNLSKIFGELLLLIESDKRGPDFAIPLTYAESLTDTFFVPENVYLIGLMNTADRSLAMVDFALRRRFAFVTLTPAFESPLFQGALRDRGVEDSTIDQIVARLKQVNEKIIVDTKTLGAGFAIGHGYFCPTSHVADSQSWYGAIVAEEIRPLLEEYWFDNPKRVEACMAILEE